MKVPISCGLCILRWDALAIGAFAAICLQEKKLGDFVQEKLKPFIALLVIWFISVFLMTKSFDPVAPGWEMLNQSLAAFFGVILVWFCVIPQQGAFSLPAKFFNWSLFRHFGKYSYAIYIFHLIVGIGVVVLFRKLGLLSSNILTPWTGWSITLSSMFVSYLLARLSWITIESPFLSIGKPS